MQSSGPKKRYKPGEMAPVTGIYLVRHNPQHRAAHEAVIIRGETLPGCRSCGTRISYEMLRTASHITHDWDFSGPQFTIAHPDFANLRKSQRFNIQLPVVVHFTRLAKKAVIHGTTENLSECGMGAMMQGKLGSGQEVVSISVELGREEKPVMIQARLRYRNGLQHGFEFTGITNTQKTALKLIVEKQRPIRPAPEG